MPGGDKSNSNYVYGVMAADDGRDAEEGGRQPDARERTESRRKPRRRTADAAPGHQGHDRPAGSLPPKQMQMQKFDGERWVRFGPILKGEVAVNSRKFYENESRPSWPAFTPPSAA